MTTETHRKAVEDDLHIPAVPWRYYVTGAILFALAVILVVSVSMLAAPVAQASTVGYLRPAVTAAKAITRPQTCDWRIVHRLDRYTTWQYVTPRLARYEHIGLCSKVIVGQDQSVIIGQDGHVADVS